jgi:hypothetical protein
MDAPGKNATALIAKEHGLAGAEKAKLTPTGNIRFLRNIGG